MRSRKFASNLTIVLNFSVEYCRRRNKNWRPLNPQFKRISSFSSHLSSQILNKSTLHLRIFNTFFALEIFIFRKSLLIGQFLYTEIRLKPYFDIIPLQSTGESYKCYQFRSILLHHFSFNLQNINVCSVYYLR